MADFRVRSTIREVLYSDRPVSDADAVVRSVARDVLAGDRLGLDSKALTRGVVREVLGAEKPNFGIARVIAEYLVRQPALLVPSSMREVLANGYTGSVLIEQVGSVYQNSATRLPVLPASQVQSITRDGHVAMFAVLDLPLDLPWSYSRTAQQYQLTVQAKVEGLPLSTSRAAALQQLAAMASAYLNPAFVWGMVHSAQEFMLVCQSTDIPYIPPTGALIPLVRQLALQARVEPLPISTETVRSVRQLALQARVEALPISVETAYTAQQLTVIASDPMPLPTSPASAGVVRAFAVQALTPDPNVIGLEYGRQTHQLTAQATDMPEPFGMVLCSADTTMVLQRADYQLPGDMVKTHSGQVHHLALAGYVLPDPPDVWSTSQYSAGWNKYTQLAQAGFYPDPDVLYTAAANSFTPSILELVTQRSPLPLWNSYTRTPTTVQLATQRTIYPDPDDMVGVGVFITGMMEQVASVAVYPPTNLPDGDLIVGQLAEQVASSVTYPNTGIPVSRAEISQLMEQVVSVVVYPSVDLLFSQLRVAGVAQQVATAATYADKGFIWSKVEAAQLVEQVATAASFTDKDAPGSYVRAGQLVEQVARVSVYPDKDVSAAMLRVAELVEVVLTRDLSLYGQPPATRRRDPIIVTRFIW